ncbi:MAG: ChaN family lipoprotein [Bacteroidota bacterium]
MPHPSLFLFCLILCLNAGLIAQEIEFSEFKIYSTEQQQTLTPQELLEDIAEVDVLFFGEEHDDNLGHWIQDTLYRMILQAYGSTTLSLEMFETDCQLVLDEYLADLITEERLIKDGRAWKNYKKAYRPLVETAKTQGQAVIAANAPRRYVKLVSRKGLDALSQLTKSAQQYLPPLPIFTADSGYYRRFKEAMGEFGHQMRDNVYHAQCTWDASMAYRIFRHWRKHKQELIFHLNGRFHTDYQQGTFAQLQSLHKKIKLKNISCFPADDYDQPDWSVYAQQGDYIILSQSREEKDE